LRVLAASARRAEGSMQRHKRLAIAATLVSLVLGSSAMVQAALNKVTEARVGFQATGPAGLEIKGATQDLSVSETEASIAITVPLANVKTGIDLRDRHMREKYLEAQKYPSATLTVARAAIKLPVAGEKVQSDAPGSLTLHGQTRAVTVHYETKEAGGAFLVNGKLHITMTDFGIAVPSYLGVTVKPDVDVSATFRVQGS
jgi:polyisoprenoid-binding protein YceI